MLSQGKHISLLQTFQNLCCYCELDNFKTELYCSEFLDHRTFDETDVSCSAETTWEMVA